MLFHFKQFSVKHEKSAMKVGTDGNLLGAWTDVLNAKTALDIGTGCGLLALMMAQRNRAMQIDAIDIDANAIEEASENVLNSPFDNIHVQQSSFEDWPEQKKYDLIVSNPPFYFDQTLASGESRILARQGLQDWKNWIPKIAIHLHAHGTFSCIFPIEQLSAILKIALDVQLYPKQLTKIYPKAHLKPHRMALCLSKTKSTPTENKLIVERKERHSYTKDYEALLKDYLIIF